MPVKKLIEDLKKKDWRVHSRSIDFNHRISDFGKEFRKNTIAMIVAALGLVMALMWQDAIKTWINAIFPIGDPQNYMIKTYAAFLFTFLAVTMIYFMSKLNPK
jgi:uncharacterized BrkB/YihY/UPF0761 family membrane protein